MKRWFTGFMMSWGMFLAIPCPCRIWDEKARPHMVACLPLTGGVVGLVWAAMAWLLQRLGCPAPLRAVLLAAAPWLVTGFLHLDGYMDVCDALLSRRDLTTRQKILKDSHCGAFAVIRLCSYFAAYLALCACVQFTPQAGLLWMMALVLERALSGYAVAAFPMAKNTGLAHTFASAADRATVRRVLALLAAVLCCAMLALGGWALVLAALAVLWRYHAVACKQFGGITGDLAGWFLQKTEIWMLAALCACQWGGLL